MRKGWLVVIGLVAAIVLFGTVGNALLEGEAPVLPGCDKPAEWPIDQPCWMAPSEFKASPIFHPGQLGYGIAVGTTRPGEEVMILFYAWRQDEVSLPGPIEFKLIKICVDGNPIKVIDQEIREAKTVTRRGVSWRTRVLSVAPANYKLSVILRDKDGHEFGKLMSTLYVPPQELNATMSLNKAEFRRGERVELTIHNEGPTAISFAGSLNFFAGQTIEYLCPDGEWRDAASLWRPPFGILPGTVLPPGGSSSLSIEVPPVPAGTYRIGKEVSADGTHISIRLTETFTVIGCPGT